MSRLLTSASNTLGPSTNILYMMSWIIIVTSWIFSSPEGKVWRHIRIKQPTLITPTITSTHSLINVFGFLWKTVIVFLMWDIIIIHLLYREWFIKTSYTTKSKQAIPKIQIFQERQKTEYWNKYSWFLRFSGRFWLIFHHWFWI